MVEKSTAVWLIILTIIVCAGVPAVMIWLTTTPAKLILGLEQLFDANDSVLLYYRGLF